MPRLAANFSLMFQEVDMLDRFGIAARIGFTGAEIQNPYEQTSEDIAEAYKKNGLEAVLFNTPAAVGAVPGREADFEAALSRALDYCERAGCRQIHCMAGVADGPLAEKTFVANLRRAIPAAEAAGVLLLLEPLNTRDVPGYFLHHTAQARRIIDELDSDSVRLQYDLYHMQIMEGSLSETIQSNLDIIGHIQIAGVPGRHEPDTSQEVQYPFLLQWLDELGYDRWVACEYRPSAGTLDGLEWARPLGIDPSAG